MTIDIPFSRPVRVEALPKDGLGVTIEADEAERAAVAALNGLPAISKLGATFALRRAGRGAVSVSGRVRAEITQTCVVSLEPFEALVDEPIDVRFAPPREEKRARRAEGEADTVALDAEDPPDPIIDGTVDLGALAAEFMALGLDPYPRKPGVGFEAPPAPPEADAPFAPLADFGKPKP